MKVEVYADADAVANKAAGLIATMARDAVADRGHFVMAVSGGHTPWQMLRALAREDVPWKGIHVVQVDERIAPAGDPETLHTCARVCLNMHRYRKPRFTPCPSRNRISKPPPAGMHARSNRLPGRRRSSTSRIWDLDRMGTRPRSFPTIPF